MSDTPGHRPPATPSPAAPSPAAAPEAPGDASGPPAMSDYDVFLFRQGQHARLWQRLGAHPCRRDGVDGVQFGVWAPNAERVAVVGDFDGWRGDRAPLSPRPDGSGIWEGFVAGMGVGDLYKYRIASRHRGYRSDRADPFGFAAEAPPRTASRVCTLDYDWHDRDWMRERRRRNALDAPMSTYEVHLGSWRRDPSRPDDLLNYRDIAHELADYASDMGFTHVELMPITEHPFYGSWGYQTTGYFAPTSRYGTPQDFMYFVDHLHQRGIGVILDWVPSHFPNDEHGLAYFDGSHLFEHEDPRQGFHPEWSSCIFNYGRHEVRAFLLSSALYWLDVYHLDGLRVDAVASMLYLDYAREPGEWVPNEHGGHENLAAVSFLRALNEAVYREHPDVQTIAEESTAWPMVSRPTWLGGLGFGLKWNMGWMHDTLKYASQDPIHRRWHHGQLTFSLWYAFSENYVLPLSHDEVVHGKGSLLGRMPGDDWQRFANLRVLFGYMWTHPGKKLVFMGGEFGQRGEWAHDHGLPWEALEHPPHEGARRWVRDLNRYYSSEPALHQLDFAAEGFEWIDALNSDSSVIAFLRRPRAPGRGVLVVVNFTPVVREGYRVGAPSAGFWREALNSDATEYGGSGVGNFGGAVATPEPAHGRPCSLRLTLPPLAVLVFEEPAGSVFVQGTAAAATHPELA
jgi:1,4-alpha-glucan branching enzyme